MMWLMLLACRPDPGQPTYVERTGWTTDTADTQFLSGPDPYEEGEQRLSLGIFYEGGYSDLIEVDDSNVFYYIYNNYTHSEDLNDRIEGYSAAVWTVSNATWFGGGVNSAAPVDLSAWDTLHVTIKGYASESLSDLQVNVETNAGSTAVDLFDEGFALDGEWHEFAIPMKRFSSDLTETTGLFVLVSDAGGSGDIIKIDNLYFTAE